MKFLCLKIFSHLISDVLEEFLNYVVAMDFDTEPDYDKCRAMFQKALKKAKFPLDGKIDFATPKNAPKKVRRSTPKRKAKADSSISEAAEDDDSSDEEVQVKTPAAKKTKKSPLKKVRKEQVAMKDAGCQTSPAFVKAAKAAKRAKSKLADNPEMDEFANKAMKAAAKATDENESSLSNPTPAMLALMAKKADKKTPVRRSTKK